MSLASFRDSRKISKRKAKWDDDQGYRDERPHTKRMSRINVDSELDYRALVLPLHAYYSRIQEYQEYLVTVEFEIYFGSSSHYFVLGVP
jgi:hypothetical protein